MSKVSTTHLTYETVPGGKIAVLTMDSPPVNSLSIGTRAGLVKGVTAALAEKSVLGMIVRGAGSAFCAGAEISEFAGAAGAEDVEGLTDTIARLEQLPFPVVALVHGFALGGGFEVALSCHYRVCHENTQFGLPEVNLGLLPGAGGTQRLPRIVGPMAAAEMILTGKPIHSKKALQVGVVDSILAGNDLLQEAIQFLLSLEGKIRPTNARVFPPFKSEEVMKQLDAYVANPAFQKSRKGEIAPDFIVGCIKASLQGNFNLGMKEEQRLFQVLLHSKESRALQHLFFAERACSKLDLAIVKAASSQPKLTIKEVGVIGSGTMGGGIAMCCVEANLPVILLDVSSEFLQNGLKVIAKNYSRSVERKTITQAQMDARMKLITGTTNYADLKDVDLVVEAVFESMKVKQDVFSKLDQVCKSGCILSSNTSGLDLDAIAQFTKRPEFVVGCHFFSPANQMVLLENVKGKLTSANVLVAVTEFGEKIRKVPILVGNCPRFVGNRMLESYTQESLALIVEGCTVSQVDRAARDVVGMGIGPFQMHDIVGLDLFWRKRKEEGKMDINSNVPDALCELGRYGQKNGKGYYTYGPNGPVEDEVTTKAIINVSEKQNIYRRKYISDMEIFERLMYPLMNEGFKCLEEGIASKPSDIDCCYIFGYSFPKAKGGPMKLAEEIGFDTVLAGLRKYQRLGKKQAYWEPSKLLIRLVEEKKKTMSGKL